MRSFPFVWLVFIGLSFPRPGFAQTSVAAKPADQPISLTLYYFKEVADDKFPNRPIQMSMVRSANNENEQYSFYDRRTGQRFRDGRQIQADMAKLTVQPPTAQTRSQLRGLKRELNQWHVFLRNSPVILTEADLKPTCTAATASYGVPIITQTFTAQGAEKVSRYTTAHVGEIMGIIVGDHVLSAPDVEEPILDGQAQISGGFQSLAEAKALADGLNAAARRPRKP